MKGLLVMVLSSTIGRSMYHVSGTDPFLEYLAAVPLPEHSIAT